MQIIGNKKEIITITETKSRLCFNKTMINNSWIKKNIHHHKQEA